MDELRGYLSSLGPHDASVAVALSELLHHADEEGRAARDVWVGAVQDAHERLVRQGGPSRGGAQSPSEVGTLGQYLEEHVLGRLEGVGIAIREPSAEGWESVRFAPGLWSEIAVAREALLEEVAGIVRDLHDPDRSRRSKVDDPRISNGEGSRLWARGLTKIYRKRKVVNEVDISVRQGEIVGLLGPNGAGKTTTFYMIVGLIPPNDGEVHLDDRLLTDVPMFKRARLGVGYLAQEPSIFRKLSVEENVRAILETLKLPKAEEKKRLEDLLDELSIAHLRKSKAYSLSGGERRRLEITRALVQRPKFMLLDEPFAGIDPIAVNDIQQIVAELKHRGIGVIISDHNVEQTLEIVDRAYIMYEGRIRVSGTVSELVWNDEVAEIYLGPILTERMRNRFARPVGTGSPT
jgi:lipopolysaccharide export system ATP-binding protein